MSAAPFRVLGIFAFPVTTGAIRFFGDMSPGSAPLYGSPAGTPFGRIELPDGTYNIAVVTGDWAPDGGREKEEACMTMDIRSGAFTLSSGLFARRVELPSGSYEIMGRRYLEKSDGPDLVFRLERVDLVPVAYLRGNGS